VSARAWALFAAMSVIWGVPYLFVKIAVDDGLHPLFIAWSRVALGALVLVPLVARTGALRGLRRHWHWLLAFTVFEIVIPFPLIGFGEQRISSSLAAILIATLPLMIALITIRLEPEERLSPVRLGGLLTGLAGVVLLMGIDVAGKPDELVGALCLFGAAIGYAIGPMIIRLKLRDADPRGVSAVALGGAALILAPAAALTWPDATPTTEALASVAVLGVLCSAVAFVLFFALIVEAGATRATIITYVNPGIAVLLGVTLLDERLGTASVIGLALILAGSMVGAGFEPAKA
jgi:drug/metabolite transporter (DMT)-like permease